MPEMRNSSWLVQRLKRPHRSTNPDGLLAKLGQDNPFAFGGGLRNGGLSAEAMDLLRPIFSFDYMGSAEFEFGEVPKALNALVNNKTLGAWEITVLDSQVSREYRPKAAPPVPRHRHSIFVVGPEEWRDEINERILGWATKGSYGKNSLQTKEAVNLDRALAPEHDWDREYIGWLEISNGYLFFVDRDAFDQICHLFFDLSADDALAVSHA